MPIQREFGEALRRLFFFCLEQEFFFTLRKLFASWHEKNLPMSRGGLVVGVVERSRRAEKRPKEFLLPLSDLEFLC